MSTIPTTMTSEPPAETATRRRPVLRAALVSGALAAAATSAVAAAADAAGVPLAVDGETIPLLGFAQLTLVGALFGALIAAGLHRYATDPRRWFVRVAIVLTAASCVPSVAYPPDVATQLVLVATHVIAAAIIVPAIARSIRR